MPEPSQLLARRGVAQLGLVAQREQRLATSGPLAGARDLQDLLWRQIGSALPCAAGARKVQ